MKVFNADILEKLLRNAMASTGSARLISSLERDPRVWEPSHFASIFAALLEQLSRPNARLLDVGTGSGVLAIYASQRLGAHATGIDIDPRSISLARRNAQKFNAPANFILADAAHFLCDSAMRFDCVVANTPSFPDGVYEDRQRGRFLAKGNGNGNRLLRCLLMLGGRVLRPGGFIITCAHGEQNISMMLRIARSTFSHVTSCELWPPVPARSIFDILACKNLARGSWKRHKDGIAYRRTVFIVARNAARAYSNSPWQYSA